MNGVGLSHEFGDRGVTNKMDALIYESFCKTAERTISFHPIWLNCSGPLETHGTKPKKVKKLCTIQNRNWNRRVTLLLSLNSVTHISTFPIIYNSISHGTSTDWKNIVFHIIEMRNGLELNSITYSNPQTNKSNIAQVQNAFYVSKSKTKEQAIKKISRISQHTIFLSYFL